MSDPINDYASVPALPASVRVRAVYGALAVAKRCNATPDEALDFLDALGLSDVASEVAGRPLVARPAATGHRDSYGRLRADQAQPPQPDPVEPAAAISAPVAGTGGLPPGCVWCKCPNQRHVLTPVSSESTYVDPRGTRFCRLAQRRKKREARKRAAELRAKARGAA